MRVGNWWSTERTAYKSVYMQQVKEGWRGGEEEEGEERREKKEKRVEEVGMLNIGKWQLCRTRTKDVVM